MKNSSTPNIPTLMRHATDYLRGKGVEKSRHVAWELLSKLLNIKSIEFCLENDYVIEGANLETYLAWIERRGMGEPFEYIVGEVDFLSCSLRTTPGVFIPRQETEILAALILEDISEVRGGTLWDLCAGGGCLGLSLKKERPDLRVTLSDLYEEPIACAKHNAIENALDVAIVQGDLLKPFSGKKADIIVCNPPYVTEEEYALLANSVRLYEPRESLLGGLSYYVSLAEELPAYLKPRARIFFEIGKDQGWDLHQIFGAGHWRQKQCRKDWAGHDRFFSLEFNKNPE